MLYGEPPSYAHLRSFGYLAYATVPKPYRDKFQSRVIPCILLGYALGKKRVKLLHLHNKSIFFSRDVSFVEHIFPSTSSPSTFFPVSSFIPSDYVLDLSPSPFVPSHISVPSSSTSVSATRKSVRTSHPPPYLQDYVCNFVPLSFPSNSKDLIPASCISEPQHY